MYDRALIIYLGIKDFGYFGLYVVEYHGNKMMNKLNIYNLPQKT